MHSVLQRLEGMRAFPYLWLVGSFAPIAWGSLGRLEVPLSLASLGETFGDGPMFFLAVYEEVFDSFSERLVRDA